MTSPGTPRSSAEPDRPEPDAPAAVADPVDGTVHAPDETRSEAEVDTQVDTEVDAADVTAAESPGQSPSSLSAVPDAAADVDTSGGASGDELDDAPGIGSEDVTEDRSGAESRSERTERSVERVPDHDLVGALEAVLLVLDNPASAADLAAAVGHTPQRVTAELRALAERYTIAGSGIELREIGGGWRMWTRDRFAPIVERFILDGAQGRLSKAALESLAVVAYRQPVTRARVSAVRGVNVDGVFRTLTARGLIEEAGTDPDSSAILYRTTPLFLDRMGLSDLAELPSLGPLLPDVADLDAALDSDLDTV